MPYLYNFFNFLPLTSYLSPLLVRHITDKLDAHQSDFLFRTFATQLVDGVLQRVALTVGKIIVDVIYMVFVHHLFKEIVDIELRTAIWPE